jgi:catechol 2,3-dioxygenase-like lactoylglutathione lyase family enzyme
LSPRSNWCSGGLVNTDLDFPLKTHGIRQRLVVGRIAHTCVETTVRFAAELGYHATVVRDATADDSNEKRHAALDTNIPNDASAIVTTNEVFDSISSVQTLGTSAQLFDVRRMSPSTHGARLKAPKPKELDMGHTKVRSETGIDTPKARRVDMKLEVVVIPVSDVDRAKRFYDKLGWRLDADFVMDDDFRVVQFTPPGSSCSIHFGTARTGVTSGAPGSAQGFYLIVSDIEAAHAELLNRGVDVSEVFHRTGREGRFSGPDPERRSYSSFVSFSDPDGNGWLVQEVTVRLPGRVAADDTTFTSSTKLAAALRRAEAAHAEHEKRTGQRDANWPDWYAEYVVHEQTGKQLPS